MLSAQLQQQLAQKGTDLSSAERELACVRLELSQEQQSKHEATEVNLVMSSQQQHFAYGNRTVLLQLLTFHQDVCCAVTCSFHFTIE